jgi:hypothetical protein
VPEPRHRGEKRIDGVNERGLALDGLCVSQAQADVVGKSAASAEKSFASAGVLNLTSPSDRARAIFTAFE